MKIQIQKSALESAVSAMQPFINKTDKSDISAFILIEAKNGALTLKATNYEMGIVTRIECEKLEDEGVLAIDGKLLLDSLKSLKDASITINDKENDIEIKQNRARLKIDGFDAEEFPNFPQNYQNAKINIDSHNLIDSLKKLLPVIEINNPRQDYRNALIEIREYQFNFVATDTKRLEIISFNTQSVDKHRLMFPKKAIVEIQKLFSDDASIFFNENEIILENEKFTFWTRIPSGNFIEYEKVIPKELKYKINIDKDKMLESLKIINAVSHQIKIIFGKEKITFESINMNSNAEASDEIDIEAEKNEEFIKKFEEDIVVCINSKHIMDFIPCLNSQFFEFGLNENSNSACVLKSDNFTLVMMPIVV